MNGLRQLYDQWSFQYWLYALYLFTSFTKCSLRDGLKILQGRNETLRSGAVWRVIFLVQWVDKKKSGPPL